MADFSESGPGSQKTIRRFRVYAARSRRLHAICGLAATIVRFRPFTWSEPFGRGLSSFFSGAASEKTQPEGWDAEMFHVKQCARPEASGAGFCLVTQDSAGKDGHQTGPGGVPAGGVHLQSLAASAAKRQGSFPCLHVV